MEAVITPQSRTSPLFAQDSPAAAPVLLVDDRPDNLLALRAILDPLELRLVEARSGAQALKCLLNEEFALILMDVQMPGMDGFETAALIKDRERTRHIPIIFVTAISKEQHYVFQGYSSGAVDYISKPFDPGILRSKVGVFVELWAKGEQIRHQGELLRRNEQLEREREVERVEREAEKRQRALEKRQRALEKRQRALEKRHMDELAASQASLAHFKTTLDATLDSVYIFDPDTLLYTYANQGALRQLGYSCQEMMSLTPLDIKPDMDQAEYRQRLVALQEGAEVSMRFETTHRRKDGSLIPVEVFLQFIAPNGEDGRFVSIARDITDRKRTEEALIAARDIAELERAEAQKANRAKSDFIAGISHELRTPLNAILGFSKLLLNPRVGPLNEDQKAYTQDVINSAEHLLQLINDVLDLSKVEAGKMTLEEGSWPVASTLEQSLSIVREDARTQKMQLAVEVPPEVAALPPAPGDARKIKQVLFNLLSNAVKFTAEGGSITLSARCESSPEGASSQDASSQADWLVVAVSDSGIGVAPEDQERIFQAFEQVDSSYTRAQQGTGLGLALSRRIVELHGGKMALESAPGQGSTFSFSLPLHRAPQTRDGSPRTQPGTQGADRMEDTPKDGVAEATERQAQASPRSSHARRAPSQSAGAHSSKKSSGSRVGARARKTAGEESQR
jgi:PAS domain S-box-containing protein